MREIKFRAWDKDRRVMLSGDDIESTMNPNGSHEYYSGLSYGVLFVAYFHHAGDWRECDVMQFTGLLDKNGKEIYEGDIVKWYINDFTRAGIVEYVDGWGGFDLKNVHDEYHVCNDWIRGEYEVLGNIHENPELLEVT